MSFVESKAACDGSAQSVIDSRKCSIPISILRADPFKLTWGTTVLIRITANNIVGKSVYGQGGAAKIYSKPDAPLNIESNPAETGSDKIGIVW